MRRRLVASIAVAAGVWLVAVPVGRAPSVEDMFVATTEAASEAEGSLCLMPDADNAAGDLGVSDAAQQIAIPTRSDTEGGDTPPVRMVVDPYPSFNGVAVDTTNDLVMMSDTNRKSLLVYDRTAGSRTSKQAAAARQQIMGPDTGVGFVAGVAMDPVHRELFTVNNDVEDRLVVFDYNARGNVNPKRLLYVPHQSWGIAMAPRQDVMALSVQTPNMFVVFKRDAKEFDPPIRSVRGPKTGMADPHGIYFDETHNEIVVANHGNFRPGELITSYTAYDARESRQERAGNAFDEPAGGEFVPSSVTVYDGDAKGDVAPLRTIQGPTAQLDWPMGVAVDEVNNEIIVANNGDNSVLTAHGTRRRAAQARDSRTADRHQGAHGRRNREGRDLGREFRRPYGARLPPARRRQRGAAAHPPQCAGRQRDQRIRQSVRRRVRHQTPPSPGPELSQSAAHCGVCQAGKRKRGAGEGHPGADDASEPDDARYRVRLDARRDCGAESPGGRRRRLPWRGDR
jgi:DNA-binding beta-propeller fold protein YncE